MTAKRTPSAHAQLDELRQQAAAERVRQRELQAQADTAELEVEQASSAIADGYAAEDQRAVTAARKAEQEAVANVREAAPPRRRRAPRRAGTGRRRHLRPRPRP